VEDTGAVRQVLNSTFNLGEWMIEPFTKGKTNNTLKCSSEDFRVIIKTYGKGSDKIIDRKRESRNIEFLWKNNLAPKVYKRFHNGYIIEYVEGGELEDNHMKSEWRGIARRLREWHSLPLISKDPILFNTIKDWYAVAREKHSDILDEKSIYKYINILEKEITGMDCRVAFCHNDLLSSNILKTKNGSIMFIDYEYSGVNYASFDIANHFCEYAGYGTEFEKMPRKDVAMMFLEEYGSTEIYEEVEAFIPASHCLWGLWGLIREDGFDYLGYGIRKLDEFTRLMRKIEHS
jgi:ethanolamine kinase